MAKLDKLLNEKYRPTKLEEYIFQNADVEYKVRKWITKGEIPNIMLTGSQGTGKSALANVIVNELGIDPADVKKVNASIEGIAYVRETLEPWMKRTSFGKFKIVVFEECDQMSMPQQKALRQITEEYSDTVRWIMTCNYPKNVIAPLHSRFQQLELNSMNYDGVLDMVVDVVEKEGISFDGDPEEILIEHIDTYQPDIRKILNSIDEHLDSDNVLHRLSGSSQGSDVDMWASLWRSGDVTLEKALALSHLIDQNNFTWFYEIAYENSRFFPDEGTGVVLCSQYLDRAQTSANQRLHLDAFLYNMWMDIE